VDVWRKSAVCTGCICTALSYDSVSLFRNERVSWEWNAGDASVVPGVSRGCEVLSWSESDLYVWTVCAGCKCGWKRRDYKDDLSAKGNDMVWYEWQLQSIRRRSDNWTSGRFKLNSDVLKRFRCLYDNGRYPSYRKRYDESTGFVRKLRRGCRIYILWWWWMVKRVRGRQFCRDKDKCQGRRQKADPFS